MRLPFPEPWDPDVPWLERLFARGVAIGVMAGMIMASARLAWLWASGIIRTEPFWGSTAWNLAIALPTITVLAAGWVARRVRARNRERELAAVMPDEPLAGWMRRIGALDAALEGGTPSHAADLKTRELTLEIVDAYPLLDATQREHVRLLWRIHEHFGVYASVDDRLEEGRAPLPRPLIVDEVRRELILHSIRDQLPDARDATVDLGALRARAVAAGVDFGALAREVAALSDDTRRDAMFGSTRELLLRFA